MSESHYLRRESKCTQSCAVLLQMLFSIMFQKTSDFFVLESGDDGKLQLHQMPGYGKSSTGCVEWTTLRPDLGYVLV